MEDAVELDILKNPICWLTIKMQKKSIAINSFFNVIYKGFTALFPLLTTTYISRVRLAEGVGRVAYVQTIATYFLTVASLGIPNYGVRVIAQSNHTQEERSKSFIELFTINFVSTVVCVLAYYFFVNTFSYFKENQALFNVMGLMLILNIFNIDWFYQGIEEYVYIANRGMAIKIISFILMLLFVKKTEDYLCYAFILCIASAGNYLLNVVRVRRYIDVALFHLEIKKHLKPVTILLASAMATEVYTMLDTVMLEYFYGTTYVGYYSNSVKVVRMSYAVIMALVATFYPRISIYIKNREYEPCNKLLKTGLEIILMLSIPVVLGIILTAKLLVEVLFGKSFQPAVGTIQILSILILVFSIAYLLGHIILMSSGDEVYILRATLTGAIVNAAANIILIPKYMHYGAAIASVLAEITVTVILLLRSRKYISFELTKNFLISIAKSAMVLVIVVLIIERFARNNRDTLVLTIFVGAVCYFSALVLSGNELIEKIIMQIKKLFS